MRNLIALVSLIAVSVSAFGIHRTEANQDTAAGMLFSEPVSKKNYNFAVMAAISFSAPWGSIPRDWQSLEERIWDELLLSYEAHQRGIDCPPDEVDRKIEGILEYKKVTFDYKQDRQAFADWAMENLRMPVETFENHMCHMVKINTLYEQVRDQVDTRVSEEEAYQEFLNEQNSLSLELAEFTTLKEAQDFYERVRKDPEAWEAAVTLDNQKPYEDRSFKRPGFVTLEFLMDLWQIPKQAVYDMIDKDIGDFYSPTAVYRGYAVYKIKDIGKADPTVFPQRQDYYVDQLKNRKKFDGFTQWLADLRQEADIQPFIDPPSELLP